MKALVTGAEGQLARSLVERSAQRTGLELAAAGRPWLDLEVPGSAERVIAAAAPDVVVNAAAYTAVDQAEDDPDRAFRINAEGAGEIAASAARTGARLIHVSTDYVFDGRAEGAYGEDSAPNPLSAYGRSKLAGEERVRAAAPDHVIVRTAWVYSPFGRNFVRTMMAAAQAREFVTVVDDQKGNPSSALDLADGLLRIVEAWREGGRAGLGGTYHLAGTGTVSWCGFARAVMDECRRLGLPAAEVRPIRSEDWPTPAARPRNSALDCTKFARDFGFAMPEWRHSLRVVVERIAAES